MFGRFTYRSVSLGKAVTSPFSIHAKVRDGKILEDPQGGSRWRRASEAWIQQRKEEAMLWNQVVILKSDIADASITALRDKYDAALRAVNEANGFTENTLVAYGKDSAGNHVFYFSPAAAAIASAAGILSEFGGTDLPSEPNLNGFTKF